ncbi:lipocalin family protein [Adhaeribacter pallidiroseus]|uniref:Lipocalin-like domain-containing protein n=1 Tax=Adhaeribacter pallidiroseus TaxID=2072847 RepID=A0A369QWJ1_9BACT|nr:lipocalin family protein [Adhaeribacter pallidiroseus]RDC66518.1 hypothetical protein AHMF7616_05149 [Adhaeribacter pallidiroseus]
MRITFLFPSLFIILLLFSSCEENSDVYYRKKNADLLINKNWVITGHYTRENNYLKKDKFVYYDACNRDDTFRFAKNGTYELNEGPTKCNANDPQVFQQGTWKVGYNNLELTKTGSSSPSNYLIVELNTYKLVLSSTETHQGDTYQEVLTFTAQ